MLFGEQIGLTEGKPTRDAFGETLKELGAENGNLIVVDGDLNNSTRTKFFKQAFPERFINVGIAESNMIGVASGLAACGKDVLASSFAAFLLGNAYDQIRMCVAYPNLNVKLVGSHSGISIGEDGPSQMAIEDLALSASLPNMAILVPADEVAASWATRAMFEHDSPVYLRTGRPNVPRIYGDNEQFEIGKAKLVREGHDVTIIACGIMVAAALEAAYMLSEEFNIEARVLDMHTIKPLDHEAIIEAATETGAIIVAEEHSIVGGLGAAVAQIVTRHSPVPMDFIAVMDEYAESGQPDKLFDKYGLTPHHIVEGLRKLL